MEIEDNEVGGTTVILVEGDDLRKVPKSHQHQITSNVREVFSDPMKYFRNIADRCPFKQMTQWLNALLAKGNWRLQLDQAGDVSATGFDWNSKKVRGATIRLPSDTKMSHLPKSLQQYYSLVDEVNWGGFCYGGGVSGLDEEHPNLTMFRFDYYGADVKLKETFVWGDAPNGDSLIYTLDDRGGWLNMGDHQIYLLGTIADTINWVYEELNSNRCPQWKSDWYQPRK